MSIFNKKSFVFLSLLFAVFAMSYFIAMPSVFAIGPDTNSLGNFRCTNGVDNNEPYCEVDFVSLSDEFITPGSLISLTTRGFNRVPDVLTFNGVPANNVLCSDGLNPCFTTEGANTPSAWIASTEPGCYIFPIHIEWNSFTGYYGGPYIYNVNLMHRVGSYLNENCGVSGTVDGIPTGDLISSDTEVLSGQDFSLTWNTNSLGGVCAVIDNQNNVVKTANGDPLVGRDNTEGAFMNITENTTFRLICDTSLYTSYIGKIESSKFFSLVQKTLSDFSVIKKAFALNYPYYFSSILDSVTVTVVEAPTVSIQEPAPGTNNGENGSYLVQFSNQPKELLMTATNMDGANCTLLKDGVPHPDIPQPWNYNSSLSFYTVVEPTVGNHTYKASCTKAGLPNPVIDNDDVSVVSSAQPDLTMGLVTPDTAVVNVAKTFTATISNIGNADTPDSFYYFFQVADAPNGTGNITDKTGVSTPVLSANGNRNVTTTHTFSIPNHVYSIRACADKSSSSNNGTITESDEDNNCGDWINVTVTQSGPDLVAGAITPVVAIKDTPVTFHSTITNQGNLSTGASFSNFIQITSEDPNGGGGGQTFNFIPRALALTNPLNVNLAPLSMGALAGGAHDTTQGTYTFTEAGIYYVRACADKNNPSSTGVIAETNEGNNCGPNSPNANWTTVTVSLSPMPDLIAGPITPTNIVVNIPTTLNSTITNQGNASTGAGFSNFFQISTLPNGGGTVTNLPVQPGTRALGA